jgi:Asp-tRNA(Asn)/Glu-tRNA(Gln) amidotransferase B subunit
VSEKGKETYLKTLAIERLHKEENAGKLVHAGSNRPRRVALAEIVSKPDLRTGRQAAEYGSEIRRIMHDLQKACKHEIQRQIPTPPPAGPLMPKTPQCQNGS